MIVQHPSGCGARPFSLFQPVLDGGMHVVAGPDLLCEFGLKVCQARQGWE